MKLADVLANPELMCGIPYAAIREMVDAIAWSETNKREMGITFCGQDHELSTVRTKGGAMSVDFKHCPKGSELGSFHSHHIAARKTIMDWYADILLSGTPEELSEIPEGKRRLFEHRMVNCVGIPLDPGEPGDEWEGAWGTLIECSTINNRHPKYPRWKEEIEPWLIAGYEYGTKLNALCLAEGRGLTEQEEEEYIRYEAIIKEALDQAEKEGIIHFCEPYHRPNIPRTIKKQRG